MALNQVLRGFNHNLALLILRVGMGGLMAFGHGLGKLTRFQEMQAVFSDPLGFGALPTLYLAIFSEFFCGLAVMLGLMTRLAAFFIMSTMATAFFIVHAADPFAKKELSLVYLIAFTVIFLAGPGARSLDAKLKRRAA